MATKDASRASGESSIALPGPPLSNEELLAELKHGAESGVADGDVVKRLLAVLREQERTAKTA